MNRRSRIPTDPRIARLIIVWLTPDELKAQIEGDLREGYRYRREINGGWRARIWYWRQLFSPDVLALRREVKMRRGRHQRSEVAMTARGWLSDVRYAVRVMKKNPGFSSVVLATLALGIGANTAVFSVVNSVLLRPLPYPESEQLAMVFRSVPRFGFTHSTASYPDFNDWRAETTSFSSLGAYGYTTLTYMGDDGAERWTGHRVTADLMTLLQVPAAVGRIFAPEEDLPGADRAILLSFGLWQARFGGDPGVVGTRLTLNGEPYTVVGVMPVDFSFPSRSTSFWVPLRGDAERMERDSNFLSVLGRLAPGVAVEHAQVEMERIAGRIDATAPRANEGYGILVEGRHAFVVSNARTALLVFWGAVALVLMIACANVANLMLARGTARRNEIAVRTALGAARGRIVRQLLTESAVLGVAGGVLGLGLAAVLLRMFVKLGTGQVPRLDGVGIDPIALGFTAFVSVAAGIVFGTVPAWLGSRSNLHESLKEGGQGAGIGRLGRRVQHSFVVAQLTLAVVLTIGAALLVNSFLRLTSVEPGFDPENVIAARVSPPQPERPSMGGMSEEEMMAMMQSVMQSRALFFDELLQRSRSLPGGTSAGWSFSLPF
ncbi:MAG: ABC transporter permease, partial [Gemmatimonadetes bacterium]|nr:ABC transporter permease [Gemmatimonadota bacterium]